MAANHQKREPPQTRYASQCQVDRRWSVDLWQSTAAVSAQNNKWQTVDKFDSGIKKPAFPVPIDDAFFDPFLFVTPSGKSSNSQVAKWVACEQAYAITRWKA